MFDYDYSEQNNDKYQKAGHYRAHSSKMSYL